MFFTGGLYELFLYLIDSDMFDWLLEHDIINHHGNPNQYIFFFLLLLDFILIYFIFVGIKTKIKEWRS